MQLPAFLPLTAPKLFLPTASFPTSSTIRLRPQPARLPLRRRPWFASGAPEPERSGNPADDDSLNRELQAKVKELFGSRKNISIDIDRASGYQFSVRNRSDTLDDQQKAAWAVIISIALISVAAGVLATILYYTGNIHGSDPADSRYDMPTYGSESFIDPYQLLDEDRQLQDSKAD